MITASKRTILLVMAVIMILGMAFAGTEEVYAAKKRKLPTKVVAYYYYNGKWHKSYTKQYKYDKKGNITVYKSDYFTEKYKNTYKSGKLRKVKGSESGITRYYNSKGCVTKEVYGKLVTRFTTNKKGYITKATGSHKYTNTVKYQSNGMPASIKYKSSGYSRLLKFKTNGRIGTRKDVWGSGKNDYTEFKVSYSSSSGRLKAIEKSRDSGSGKWEYCNKYVYSFGEVKTKNKRKYASMMGECQDPEVMQGAMPEHFFAYGNG